MCRQFLLELALLLIAIQVESQSHCNVADRYFQCNQSDLSFFKFDTNIKCNVGTLCNKNYLKDDISNECKPCIPKESVCKFQCVDQFTFKINDQKFTCENSLICNAQMKTNCQPCVPEVCDEMKWSCLKEDPTVIMMNNIKGRCNAGYICNTENVPPCDTPCIIGKGTISTTTETEPTKNPTTIQQSTISSTITQPTTTIPTTTITTTARSTTTVTTPATPTTLSPSTSTVMSSTATKTTETITSSNSPTIPTTTTNTESSSSTPTPVSSTPSTPTTVASSTIETSESTTTASTGSSSTSVLTSSVPPFQIPNCNDGHGDTNPCRPGPSNNVYYYKCKYYSPVWYDYEIKLCQDVRFDPVCVGKVC